MSPAVKFLTGLAAVVAMGWIHHGPLGNGEAFIQRIESQAQAAVGEADEFQREGQGSLKGINDIVGEIEGISDVQWANEPPTGGGGTK
jgi:hypothetical protein